MSEPVSPLRNHLLEGFPADVQQRLFPFLRLDTLRTGKVLSQSSSPVREVYFPIDSVVSLLYETDDGLTAELLTVGDEGVVGLDALLGSRRMVGKAIVQSAGRAYRLSALRLTCEFNANPLVRMQLLGQVQSVVRILAQLAICNRHHSIEQQLCRWLLLTLNRRPGEEMKITQHEIASRLGVRREGVTHAACRLQKLGVISCVRGRMRVLERSALEKLSCGCYAMAAREYDSLRTVITQSHSPNLANGAAAHGALCATTHRSMPGGGLI
jgi:CRP-like cAMP-binding protein